MGNRFGVLLVLALLLSGCDLLKPASASGSPDAQLGLPAIGTVAPPSSSATSGLPSPSALASTIASLVPSPSLSLPSASLTLPPSFAPPSLPLPTIPIVLPTPATPSPSPTIARPAITAFVPESGFRGSIVTITGTNLASVTLVLFGDVATAPKSPPTATTVVAIVPLAAISAPISLVSPAGVVTSSRFFIVEEPALPTPTPCPPIRQCPSPSP